MPDITHNEKVILELLLIHDAELTAAKKDIQRISDELAALKNHDQAAENPPMDVAADPSADVSDHEAESEAPASADIAAADVAANDEGGEWIRFVLAWQAKFGPAAVTVSDLIDLAGELPLGDGNERSRKTKLGLLLAAHHDQQFQGCWLQMVTMLNGSQRWQFGTSRTSGPSRGQRPLGPLTMFTMFNPSIC